MPEGPLFAADDDYGPAGGTDDYAYDDDSDDDEEAGDDSGGEDEDDAGAGEDEGDEADSAPAAAAASKSAFDDADPSPVEHCQPGTKTGKKAEKKICSVATIKKNLDTCDGGTNAWVNAKKAAGKEPTVEVKKTKSGFDAETSGSTITIKPTTNCCDATESLLFELHNVESHAIFDKIDIDADNGLYSREDYTRANERVEYDGLKRNWETFDKCKQKWGCGAGAKSFADGFRKAKDFDDYYKTYLSKSHKDHYREAWDKHYKAKYEAKKN